MSEFAQVQAQPLGHLHQQLIADRVSVIVVDVLEIVDVEERQREAALSVVVLQETVDPMLDHAPRRQAGQFVVIGGAEQVIFERLLFGDVGRTRDQQIASGDLDRPMRGEKHLLGRTAGNGFFRHGRAAVAQQFETGIAALVRLSGRWRRCGGLQQGGRGIVHQHELAVLVLNRHASRKQPEDIPQDAQFGFKYALIASLRRGRLKVVLFGTMHATELGKVPCSIG